MVQNKKQEEEAFKSKIKKLCDPIFNKSLNETNLSSMTTTKTPISLLWRPNNYRRKIKIKPRDNSGFKTTIPTIEPTVKGQIKYNTHTKLIFLRYKGITLQIGKNTITGIWSQERIGKHKKVYLIESYKIKDIEERISQKKQEIKDKIDSAILEFINKFNLKLPFEHIVWDRGEDWIKGDDFIDKIPKETIIHDTYFKKVYPEGIEFIGKNPTASIKNYIKNRAIEDISPEIAKELKYVRSKMYRDRKSDREKIDILMDNHEQLLKELRIITEIQKTTVESLKSNSNLTLETAKQIQTTTELIKNLKREFDYHKLSTEKQEPQEYIG